MIRKLASWGFSLASFGGGGVVAVLIYPLLAIPLYVVLVLLALLTDTSTGGPFALPLLLVVGTVAGIGYTVVAYAVVGLSTLVASRTHRRTLTFVLANVVLLLLALVACVVVLGVREPAMTTIEALAWSAVVVGVGLPAWAVVASVWFGLRVVRGAVRLVENSVDRGDRAVVAVSGAT
jgi:hypothetical protein